MAPKKQTASVTKRKTPSAKTIKNTRKSTRSTHRWSAKVTKTSDALDLKPHLFENRDPSEIAKSLKRSAERSKRRKGTPFQSAMSMLTFYINRAGKNLSARRRQTLDRAKGELRKAFGRTA
ncbi:MAG: DUF3175 domain-containing protein [Proteobacteria bacterium]|nr:DUF3175 domain-containing protein [Pseudomonadota bacterium]